MSRPKKPKPDPKCGLRLKEVIEEEGLSQAKFAHSVNFSENTISKACCGLQFTETVAERIVEVYPRYNLLWLLGYSDIKYSENYVDGAVMLKSFYEAALNDHPIPEDMKALGAVLDYAGYNPRWLDGLLIIEKDGHTASFSPELLTSLQEDIRAFLEYRLSKLIERGL